MLSVIFTLRIGVGKMKQATLIYLIYFKTIFKSLHSVFMKFLHIISTLLETGLYYRHMTFKSGLLLIRTMRYKRTIKL